MYTQYERYQRSALLVYFVLTKFMHTHLLLPDICSTHEISNRVLIISSQNVMSQKPLEIIDINAVLYPIYSITS